MEEYLYKKLENKYGKEFADWAKKNNNVERKYLLAGCKNWKEYKDKNARKLGFKNNAERYRERKREYNWNIGLCGPKEFNEDSPSYFGDIGERLFKLFLEEIIFRDVKITDYNDEGVDFICKNARQEFIDKHPQFRLEINKEYSIQLKLRCLADTWMGSIGWSFGRLCYNNVPDYFILCGWNYNREEGPLHIWLFHKDEIIRGKKFWIRNVLWITNKPRYLIEFNKYELRDELEKLISINMNIE
jgi:hypothetical protein